jgi:exopolyphosphatase/guanosine-5'-triphosphate,3'-diphosphate pyrophosphatase
MLNKRDSVGLIDIGSNSVRLCIYKGNMRNPDVLYNKKFFCGLGEYKPGTKEITKEAEKKCVNSIIFFNSILEEIKTNQNIAICTAAIRNAANRKQIVNKISKVFKGKVITLLGSEEAELAAKGVIAAIPDASGTMIDMGGGSIELASIHENQLSKIKSFPLGVLNFEQKDKEFKNFIKELSAKHKLQKNFYLIGGTFRSIARCYIHLNEMPLNEIHQLKIKKNDFKSLQSKISAFNFDQLTKVPKISIDRVKHLHIALKVIDQIFFNTQCEELIYPRYGVREGYIYSKLSKKLQNQDPTEISLDLIAKSRCRFLLFNEKSFRWIEKKYLKFKNKKLSDERLRVLRLACKISDLGWEQGSKNRAQYAFSSILNLPLIGIGYNEKIIIGYLIYLRHCKEILSKEDCDKKIEKIINFLTAEERAFGYEFGSIIHFLYSWTKGSSAALKNLSLKNDLQSQLELSNYQTIAKTNKVYKLFEQIKSF